MSDQTIDYAALADQARQGTPTPGEPTGNVNYNLLASQARGEQLEPIEYRNGMPVYSIDVFGRAGPPPQPPVYQGTDEQGQPVIAPPPAPASAPMPWELMTPAQQRANTQARLNPRTGLPMRPMPMGTIPLIDAPYTGTVGIGQGIERMAEPVGGSVSPKDAYTPGGMQVSQGLGREQAGGASQIVRGALDVASPALPGAFAGAPLATALTLGAGTGLSAVTEAGLNYAGVPKEYSALTSDLVGLFGAHKTLTWLGGIANLPYIREANAIKQRLDSAMERANDMNATPMERAAARAQVAGLMDGLKRAEAGSPGGYFMPQVSIGRGPGTPWVKNQLNPIEQASQDYLREQGINTPLSMQTGDPRAAHLEGAVRQSLGGGYANQAREGIRGQIQALGPREFSNIGPEVTPEQAGAAVKTKLGGDLEQQYGTLASQVSPNPSTPETAGGAVSKRLADYMERLRSTLAGQVSPTPSSPELAGTKVLEAGKKMIRQYDQAADESYKAAWQAERDPRNIRDVPVFDKNGRPTFDEDGNPVTEKMALPVDVSDVQKALKPIADRYERTLSDTDAHASLGLKAMRNFIKDAPIRPLSAVELDLGMLKDAARNENLPELRDTSQGLAAASVKALQAKIDQTMATAAYPGWDPTSGTPSPALRHLQAGRANTAKKYDIADVFKGFGRKNLEDLEPVGVHRALTWGGDSGIQRLRDVAAVAPETMPEVGRAFIDGGGNWDTLGPETKRVLFRDPELIRGLDDYYAKKAQFGPLTEKEPVALFKSLTAPGDAGIDQLRDVEALAPQMMPAVGRAYLDGGGKWESLGPETKNVLFRDPELIKNLDEYYAKHEKFAGLTEMEPVALFDKLTAPRAKSNELLADVKEHAPEQMPGLLRAFVGELWNRATREGDFKKVQSTLDKWLQMDPKSKALMVDDPQTVRNLDNLFFSLKRLNQEVNPSGSGYIIALNKLKSDLLRGTGLVAGGALGFGGHGAGGAAVGAGAGMMAGAGAEMLANKGLARLLFDPKFTKLLTQGIKFQLRGNDEGARLIGETLSRMAAEAPPEEPPAGQTPAGGTPPSGPVPAGAAAAPETPASRKQGFLDQMKEFLRGEEGASPSRRGRPMGYQELMGEPEKVLGGEEAPRTLKLKPTGEGGQLLTSDLGQALENSVSQKYRLGKEVSPERRKARALEAMTSDLRYALAEDDGGAGWYTDDVATMEKHLTQARPEFKDPAKMSLFKYVLGITSNGVDPEVNFDAALRGWDMYQRDGKFSAYDKTKTSEFGNPKGLGLTFRANGYEGAMNRLSQLITDKGEAGAAEWLQAKHPVSELKQYYKDVRGKAGEERYGSYIFGEKVGSFGSNLNGIHTELTADKWWSRSWNRWMGTLMDTDAAGNVRFDDEGNPLLQDTPRNEGERNLMRETAANVAKDLGLKVSELQAILWYAEQRLYRFYGIDASSVSYADAARKQFGNAEPKGNDGNRGTPQSGGSNAKPGKGGRSPTKVP